VRKLWPFLGVALTLALVGSLSAQLPVTFDTGTKAPTMSSQYVDLNRMLPKVNTSGALIAPQGTGSSFSFSKFLPNFSFSQTMGPPQTGMSRIPRGYFFPYAQKPATK
jgi:hypothetical protein